MSSREVSDQRQFSTVRRDGMNPLFLEFRIGGFVSLLHHRIIASGSRSRITFLEIAESARRTVIGIYGHVLWLGSLLPGMIALVPVVEIVGLNGGIE